MRKKQLYNDTGLPFLSLTRLKNQFETFVEASIKKTEGALGFKINNKTSKLGLKPHANPKISF